MPNAKVLEQKKIIVAELCEKLKKSCSGVIVDYKGINVANDTKLRKEMREAGVNYFVVKNTLLSLAATEVGLEGIKGVLEGTTAIAISDNDYTAGARILCAFAEKNPNFKIKVGFVDGSVLDAEEVVALSKLPSREELVSKVLYTLNAPITGFVRVLNANITGLACVLNAIAEKKGA